MCYVPYVVNEYHAATPIAFSLNKRTTGGRIIDWKENGWRERRGEGNVTEALLRHFIQENAWIRYPLTFSKTSLKRRPIDTEVLLCSRYTGEFLFDRHSRDVERIIYELIHMLITGPVSRIENCIVTYAGGIIIIFCENKFPPSLSLYYIFGYIIVYCVSSKFYKLFNYRANVH